MTINIRPVAGGVALPATGPQLLQIKSDLGLGNVDNTPDSTKPVSTPQQNALNALTKASVGLANVDNTADSAKPVSTAQATAIAAAGPLISGTSIKTINGASVLGSGDLVVAGVGGQTDAFDVATFTAALPFSVTGFGSRVAPHTVTTAINLTASVDAIEGGACEVILLGDGNSGHNITVPTGWVKRGSDVFDTALNHRTKFTGEFTGGTVVYAYIPLPAASIADTTAPTLVSAIVADGTPSVINLTWSEAINSSISAAPFSVNSGHALTGHTYIDATHTDLATTTPFIPGETKTLTYVVPGSNPIQDLAANLALAFSGTAITDNVTAPTLVSAIVANGAPTHIVLTWSEPMSSTISAFGAFTVSSGHPLTAHTYVDATHTFLTTSTAFVASETVTLTYVVPGSNKMSDAGGTLLAAFAGVAITDNVSGGGGKITLTDSFTGTDGSAPNPTNWSPDSAGWTIQSNKLTYNSATVYGVIATPCTPGDNSVSIDIDLNSVTGSYTGLFVRYIDGNNYTFVQVRDDISNKLRIGQVVGGAVTAQVDDTVQRVPNSTPVTLTAAFVGSTLTVTVTGGPAPGSFGGTFSGNATATLVALGNNTFASAVTLDNFVLA